MNLLRFSAAFLFLRIAAQAHVGSPDVYLQGKAGPYQLFVTVRPPLTIPGVAELEVRSETPGIRELRAVPLAMTGAGAKFAPIPDALNVSPKDPRFFTGSLWMMTSGSWQVRLTADGAQGQGILSVPVPSFARSSKTMQFGLGAILSVLGIFLIGGLVAMVGAASREAKLDPGTQPSPTNLRSGRNATIVATVVVLAIVFGGNYWWNSEARDYSTRIYKPLKMSASLQGNELLLEMKEPGWMQAKTIKQAEFRVFTRKMDDLVPDHGHIMHLYAIRQPGLDIIYHLHPEQRETGSFALQLPSMAAGHYRLYADIVHANGFPETLVTELDVPAITSRALAGDDAYASTNPWQQSSGNTFVFTLPDGYKMEWVRDSQPLAANRAMSFTFRLTKPDGSAPPDMGLYMGMLGHAAFVKTDGSVFAHIHPNGTASMAALMLASGDTSQPAQPMKMDMPGMDHNMPMTYALPNSVNFPYGFPSPGRYRIFVQMRHSDTVETGVFDAVVSK